MTPKCRHEWLGLKIKGKVAYYVCAECRKVKAKREADR